MSTITIATRDEMYFVALPQVAYFKAEGHYTTVLFLNGTRLLLPCGLAKVREKILATDHPDGAFTQMGRSLLVNTEAVCCINPVKEAVILHGTHGQMLTVHVSKSVLRRVMADCR